ncbi:tryptophan-rich sensory protein [Paenalkalicoccus suaedae]|uniref:Tryptophan-rich sensory protein n=1 Tax=Paenalkalicoccus suaedae TaxID=2592382 RepID=A0A859FBA4_9BACI|nr:tryptophan-rich sensory protein [Paenalkalicoccus suaedae]
MAFVVAMNGLANGLPLNNRTTGELSDTVNVLFTPAGYVFSIWGLIYLLLAIWVVRSFFTKQGTDERAILSIGYLFVFNGIFNVAWLFSFHYELFTFTIVPMVALLLTIIVIYYRIKQVGASIWTRLPFSVYMGWVSVATIVNIGIFFNSISDGNGIILSNVAWTIILLPIGAVLAAGISYYLKDAVYSLVFIWAYIGIAIERMGTYPSISLTAAIVAGVLIAVTIYLIIRLKALIKIEV